MKKALFLVLVFLPLILSAQLKKDLNKPDFSQYLTTPQSASNSLFGFLDPSKLTMSHQLSMSYSSFGGQSVMLNSYVNTMNYRFNDQWNLKTNLGIVASPYNSMPNNAFLNENQFFGGAELTYKPSDKTTVSLKIESMPYYMYSPYNSYYSNRFNWMKDRE